MTWFEMLFLFAFYLSGFIGFLLVAFAVFGIWDRFTETKGETHK